MAIIWGFFEKMFYKKFQAESKRLYAESKRLLRVKLDMNMSQPIPGKHQYQQNEYIEELNSYLDNPQLFIEITSICNFACKYCVSPLKLRSKNNMTMELFEHIAKQAPALTDKPVRLHIDGEPTSHPQFSEMVRMINDQGLPIALATNGSLLKPEFVGLWMNALISCSTTADELTFRHNKLDFDEYVETIANYVRAWAHAEKTRQVLNFQIVYYYGPNAPEYPEYNASKLAFIKKMVTEAGLDELCEEVTSLDDNVYILKKHTDGQKIQFLKQRLSGGGLYPVDGKVVEGERVFEGFCDSPWKRMTIQNDGTISSCCVDLSGGTTYSEPEEIWTTSLVDLWKKHEGISKLRNEFLEGKVTLDVCQRCLSKAPTGERYVAPSNFQKSGN